MACSPSSSIVCLAAGRPTPRRILALALRSTSPSSCWTLDELRLALEVVEQKHSGKFGQAQAGSDLWKMGFFGCAIGIGFLIDEGGFGNGGSGGAIFFVLFRGRPIDERGREFLPFFALGAVVADALTLDLIFRDRLVGAVFEDKAAGELLRGGAESRKARVRTMITRTALRFEVADAVCDCRGHDYRWSVSSPDYALLDWVSLAKSGYLLLAVADMVFVAKRGFEPYALASLASVLCDRVRAMKRKLHEIAEAVKGAAAAMGIFRWAAWPALRRLRRARSGVCGR